MARQKKQKLLTKAKPALRSTLYQVLATRKSGRHKPDAEKRVAQKLRRELQEDS